MCLLLSVNVSWISHSHCFLVAGRRWPIDYTMAHTMMLNEHNLINLHKSNNYEHNCVVFILSLHNYNNSISAAINDNITPVFNHTDT